MPIIVSGFTSNAGDIDAKISVDNDTLNILNEARFAIRRNDLWFRQLPGRFYSFPSPTCHIPPGKVTANCITDFNLSELDLNEQRALPLTVGPNNSYTRNIHKGWYKALLNINLFNNYSERYPAINMNVYIGGMINDSTVGDNRLAHTVDDHSIFLYAGIAWKGDVNRYKYKVITTSGEGTPDVEGNITGSVTTTVGDPTNKVAIEQGSNCTYPYRISKHPTKSYFERRVMMLYPDYRYSDATSDLSNPIRLHCRGNTTMERQYNILVPGEE